jgi:hypothetical protein
MQELANEVDGGRFRQSSLAGSPRRAAQNAPRTRRSAGRSPSRSPSPAREAFSQADKTGNGVLTRDDFIEAYVTGGFANSGLEEAHILASGGGPDAFWEATAGGSPGRSTSPLRLGGDGSREAKRLAEARQQVIEDAKRNGRHHQQKT